MIKISGNTRSDRIIKALNEADTNYAYLDDSNCVRWIFDAGPYRQGFGHFKVYKSNKKNLTSQYGSTLFGYQDTARTIINRSQTKLVYLDEELDLTPILCP